MSEKWACIHCTYENWPNSRKCTICCNPRVVKFNEAEEVNNCNEKLIINSDSNMCKTKDFACNGNDCQCVILAEKNDSINEDSLVVLTESLKNKVNIGSIAASKETHPSESLDLKCPSKKWICNRCTYENWPKSRKCVMCLQPKDRENKTGSDENVISEDCQCRLSPQLIPKHFSLSKDDNRWLSQCDAENLHNRNYIREWLLNKSNFSLHEDDIRWLSACLGIVLNDVTLLQNYLEEGGNVYRKLTLYETNLLDSMVTLNSGDSLVHLAIKYKRSQFLTLLLRNYKTQQMQKKRIPCLVAEDLAVSICCHILANMHHLSAKFPLCYVLELATFTLPAEIGDLHPYVQEQLWSEMLDQEVQKELEADSIINWSDELTSHLRSRLYALWNRTAGDCLLDSALQGCISKKLEQSQSLVSLPGLFYITLSCSFYPRWRSYEISQAQELDYQLDDSQLEDDWDVLVNLAAQPGEALDQIHVLALAHVLQRPIIVYGVKYIKSVYGEALGYERFEGIYLPFLLEPAQCWKCPIALGYTRGHFSALVAMEPDTLCCQAGSALHEPDRLQVVFLPLISYDGKMLPVHFLTQDELSSRDQLLRLWLEVSYTESGILVAEQHIHKPPLLVAQMLEEWLNYYRHLSHAHYYIN